MTEIGKSRYLLVEVEFDLRHVGSCYGPGSANLRKTLRLEEQTCSVAVRDY